MVPAVSTSDLDLDGCAQEPIRIPGSIQPHGGLVVVDLIYRVGGSNRILIYRFDERSDGDVLAENSDGVLASAMQSYARSKLAIEFRINKQATHA